MVTPLSVLRFAILVSAMGMLFVAPGARADGRADWRDYAWQTIRVADCVSTGSAYVCPPYHQRWDWKRNQWVDIAISFDVARGSLELRQTLTDRDSNDDDDVCVTALLIDSNGTNILAHHQNWHMVHGKDMKRDFIYRSSRLAHAATFYIGSKQCRKGPHQDDKLYADILSRIPD